ncbi:hypothetical protein NX059_003843 [Plenodomus lindquistii]|nr:hypothetical protein NX059_003843 [Plenodomus lindquistii]
MPSRASAWNLTTAAIGETPDARAFPARNTLGVADTPPWDSESAHTLHGHGGAVLTRSSKPFQSTYYDARMRASPALLRARAPYLVKNTITGAAICTLVIGIYTYTIQAISQDEFEDVIVPDQPAQQSAQQPLGTVAAVQEANAARK